MMYFSSSHLTPLHCNTSVSVCCWLGCIDGWVGVNQSLLNTGWKSRCYNRFAGFSDVPNSNTGRVTVCLNYIFMWCFSLSQENVRRLFRNRQSKLSPKSLTSQSSTPNFHYTEALQLSEHCNITSKSIRRLRWLEKVFFNLKRKF